MNKKILVIASVVIIIGAGSIVVFNLFNKNKEKITISIDASLVKLSSYEITRQSDGVAVGTIKNLKVTKAPSNFRADEEDIVTNATIAVEKYLFNPKNLSEKEIIVQTVGGTIDNVTMSMSEAPVFEKNQNVVLFLRQKSNNIFIVFGGVQGAYTISNGMVAISEREKDVFNDVFGKTEMTVENFEKEIYSIVASLVKE